MKRLLFVLSIGVALFAQTAPTFNNLTVTGLGTPGAPTVTPTCTGTCATSYSYVEVATLPDGSHSAASAAGSTSANAATLDSTHYNVVTTAAVTSSWKCDVYRTVGGATQGKIGTVKCGAALTDNGLAGDASTAPTSNTTGTVAVWMTLPSGHPSGSFGAVVDCSENTLINIMCHGAVGDGSDDTVAVQAAFTAAANAGQCVYVPTVAAHPGQGFTVDTITISQPSACVVGDGFGSILRAKSNGTNPLSFASGAHNGKISNLQIIGTGASSTGIGVLVTNSHDVTLDHVYIRLNGIGVRFATGGGSSYGGSINDSVIVSNNTKNIDAQAASNQLSIKHTTFGSAPIGLSFIDSAVLHVLGSSDCEGAATTCIDLDSTGAVSNLAATIDSLYVESSAATGGDIRIGNTGVVHGVAINLPYFSSPAGGNAGAINCLHSSTDVSVWGPQYVGYTNKIIGQCGSLVTKVGPQLTVDDTSSEYTLMEGTRSGANPVDFNISDGTFKIYTPVLGLTLYSRGYGQVASASAINAGNGAVTCSALPASGLVTGDMVVATGCGASAGACTTGAAVARATYNGSGWRCEPLP